MGIPVNPTGCCGGGGACCGGHTIPSRLVATAVTSCGTFTFPIVMSRDDEIKTVWKGQGSFECKADPYPHSPCYSYDLDIEIELQHLGCEYGSLSTGSGGCGSLGIEAYFCPPFYLAIDLKDCNCIDELPSLVITE